MTFGKPEVKKEAVAGGVTTLSELLREREKDGVDLDELFDLVGDVVRRLSEHQQKIGSILYGEGKAAPAWLSDKLTGEIILARLAKEIAPHSAGGAGESSVGPVTYKDSILCTFQKNHAGYVGR